LSDEICLFLQCPTLLSASPRGLISHVRMIVPTAPAMTLSSIYTLASHGRTEREVRYQRPVPVTS
jgi:hypothetical protein